jgi:cyclin A
MKKYRPTPYMDSQPEINPHMRAILVDWLVEVAEEYKLASETLYLTINYIDRYLGLKQVPRCKLQLIGVVCMLIASKFEEVYAPAVDEFAYISDHTYTKEEVCIHIQ